MSLRKKEFIINMIVLAIIAIIMFLANEFAPTNTLRIIFTIGSHIALMIYLIIFSNSYTTYFGISKNILAKIHEKNYGEIMEIVDVKENYSDYDVCEYDIRHDHFIERTLVMSSGKRLILKENFYGKTKDGKDYEFSLSEIDLA